MGGSIVARIIDMYKGPVNNGDRLEEVGEHLAEVVAVLKGHVGGQDNVDLDDELVAGVVGAQVLDAADGGGEAHGEVEEQVALVGLGREAAEVADVVDRRLGPLEDDEEGASSWSMRDEAVCMARIVIPIAPFNNSPSNRASFPSASEAGAIGDLEAM